MKSKVILRTLCAGLILASVTSCAGVTGSSTPTSSSEPTSQTSTVSYYSVSTSLKGLDGQTGKGAYLDVDVTSARKNQTIQLTVVLTDENYEVDSVKVGNKTLSGSTSSTNSRIRYYLYTVGEEDVEFVVTTYDTVAVKSHSVSYNDENGLSHADGLATRADEGEEVSFTIGTVSGYAVEGLKIYYMNGTDKVDVVYTGNSVTGYKFTMPAANVVIEPTVLGAYFKADFDTSVLGQIGTKKYKTQDFVYEMYVENGQDDEGNTVWEKTTTYFARAGQKCSIIAKNCYQLRLKDFVINGKTVEADETPTKEDYVTYSFTMSNYTASIKAEIVDGAKESVVSLKTDAPEHLNVELFTIDETTAEDGAKTYAKRPFDGKWKYGEVIYISAEGKTDSYGPGSVTAKFKYTQYKTTATSSSDSTISWGGKSGYYDTGTTATVDISTKLPAYAGKTVMSYTPNENYNYVEIEIALTERELKFKDKEIVKLGKLNAHYIGSITKPTSSSPVVTPWSYQAAAYTIQVSGDGAIKVDGTEKDFLKDDYDGSETLFTSKESYQMFFEGSIVAVSSNKMSSYSYGLASGLYIASSKSTEDTKVKYISTLNSTTKTGALLFGFYNDDKLIDQALCYYDSTGTFKMTSKVKIVTDETDPFAKTAKVTVKSTAEGTPTLATFNIIDSSTTAYLGKWNIAKSNYGSDVFKLTLNSDGTGTYNGENINYTVTEATDGKGYDISFTCGDTDVTLNYNKTTGVMTGSYEYDGSSYSFGYIGKVA